MMQGTVHSLERTGTVATVTRWLQQNTAGTDWVQVGARVRGPLLTLVTAIALDQMARHGLMVLHPTPLLLLTVVYAAYAGGLRSGLISAVLTALYAVHYFSEPVGTLRYTSESRFNLIVVGLVAPAIALLVSRLHDQAQKARALEVTRAEAEALDRRLSFFSQASVTLASSLDYEATLRDLARLTVPVLADWCAIHVNSEQGSPQFVAGAHRDPARDLLVRALCEYGERALPFGGNLSGDPEPVEVDDRFLQQHAEDSEQLKLYRALAPSSFVQVPMYARGRIVGVLTFATAREYSHRFRPDDVNSHVQLADRAALAVDNGRLYQEASEAEGRYRMLFEANPQPMWVFDVDSLAFLAVNEAAIRHYGYTRDEFLAMTIMDIRPPDDTPGLMPGLERGARQREVALTQHQRKDGTIIDVEITSHGLELEGRRARLVLAADISERTRTRAAFQQKEEQLRQAQRMDVVGRLASGVSHDFNNLLTSIRGFSEILLRDLPGNDRHRADVEQIRKAAERGVLLTRQLQTFGRPQSREAQPLNLDDVIRGMEGLVRRLAGADIKLQLRLKSAPGALHMDPGQLEQVLVNLVLNARDAMGSGGTLSIETTERQISGSARGRHVRPGRYLVLAISDTGAGMDADTLAHMFDPVPATTPQLRRSGLALSIVYGIVRQNGGVVRVSSEPEQGTTIKIYLPRVEEVEAAVSSDFDAGLRGNETILIAEDEDGVRELLRKILIEHGHTVLEARHGKDALLAEGRYERPIHLLVTDVVMPEMSGSELVNRLAERRPGVRVLYVSGYTDDEVVRRGISRTRDAFIQKPFTATDLMRKVREVLDSESSTTSPAAASS
jgi:two-component system, cell cycle sensor histidine kinase and response regulator CckA